MLAVDCGSLGASCNTPIVIAPIVAAAASGIHQRHGLVASAGFAVSRGAL
jgi:hypothetical protein